MSIRETSLAGKELIRDARNNFTRSGTMQLLSAVASVLPGMQAGPEDDLTYKNRRIGAILSGPSRIRNVGVLIGPDGKRISFQEAVQRRIFIAVLPLTAFFSTFYVYCEEMVTLIDNGQVQGTAHVVPLWSDPLSNPRVDPAAFKSGIKEGIQRAGFVPVDDQEKIEAFNAIFEA